MIVRSNGARSLSAVRSPPTCAHSKSGAVVKIPLRSIWRIAMTPRTARSTIVATISTYKGFTASGGARGVGKAVTESAIYINVYIVIINFISSSLLEWIHDLLYWFIHMVERFI